MDLLAQLDKIIVDEPVEHAIASRYHGSHLDPNQFENWYPVVLRAGVRSPKTEVFPLPQCVSDLADPECPEPFFQHPAVQTLVEQVRAVFARWAVPALFVKNSLFSAKHHWQYTCWMTPETNVAHHLMNLQYLWCSTSPVYATALVVREVIPCKPAFYAFHGMPITREYRLFVDGAGVYAYQPYWPELAIRDPQDVDWKSKLAALALPEPALLAEMVSMAVAVMAQMPVQMPQDWSVDFLIDDQGQPWLIDMAVAVQSYQSPERVLLEPRHPD